MPSTTNRLLAVAAAVADTDPKTAIPATPKLAAGTYKVVFTAPGYGLTAAP